MAGWVAVRCVFEIAAAGSGLAGTYEERITLWRATDLDAAISLAEAEADEHAAAVGAQYLGLAHAHVLADGPAHGAEVYSVMRDSQLTRVEYLDRFFDTGPGRQHRLHDRASTLARLEQQFGVRLPDDYRQLMLHTDGRYEVTSADSYLVLYPPGELAALDEAGEHRQRFPGGLAIGGDGSRENLVYDFRRSPPVLVLLDITAASWDDAIFQAPSLTELLGRFPQTGWRFEDDNS